MLIKLLIIRLLHVAFDQSSNDRGGRPSLGLAVRRNFRACRDLLNPEQPAQR
jgi:hypothetical protein